MTESAKQTAAARFMKYFAHYQLFTEFRTAYDDANEGAAAKLDQAAAYLTASSSLTNSAALLELSAEFITAISEATAEAFPTSAGLSFDATSVARGLCSQFWGGDAIPWRPVVRAYHCLPTPIHNRHLISFDHEMQNPSPQPDRPEVGPYLLSILW